MLDLPSYNDIGKVEIVNGLLSSLALFSVVIIPIKVIAPALKQERYYFVCLIMFFLSMLNVSLQLLLSDKSILGVIGGGIFVPLCGIVMVELMLLLESKFVMHKKL